MAQFTFEESDKKSCKGCGEPIIFINLGEGKKHPVNAKVKKLFVEVFGVNIGGKPLYKLRDCYESHFATCPKADDFRKGKNA